MLSIAEEFCVAPCVSVDCAETEKFIRHTNEDVFQMADDLQNLHDMNRKTELTRMSKEYGLNFVLNGLLFIKEIRSFYRPVSHQIRDWMHMICNGGVANTELGLLLQVLLHIGIPLLQIQNFIVSVTLPSKHGKVERQWLGDNRIQDDNLKSFASVVCTLVPIMVLFLDEVVCQEIREMIADHLLCLRILRDIIGILSLGADDAVPHVGKLREYLHLHAKLFRKLYPLAAKPKFHHLLHLVDNIEFLGKLLSCFVTERKHRQSKKSALHVFRHMEHTVLADMVNKFCGAMTSGKLFRRMALIDPRPQYLPHSVGLQLMRATAALLPCGQIAAGDIVYLTNHVVGRVAGFWGEDGDPDNITVEIHAFARESADCPNIVRERSASTIYEVAESIIDACVWLYKDEGLIQVIEPFAARDLSKL